MNKDIFSKKYTILWITVLLLYAIICACFFFVFISPLSNTKVAEAEVSNLEYNTTYYFSSCRVPTGYTFMNSVNTSSWSGVLTFDNVSYSFDLISCQYMKTGVNYTYNLWFSLSGTTVYLLRFSSSSPYNLVGTGINSSNLVSRTPEAFSSATITFSAFNSSYSSITQFFKVNLSVYVPPVVVPDSPVLETAGDFSISIIGKYYNYDVSSSEWYTNNNVFVMLKCDYADSFYNSDYHGVLLKLRMYDAAENLVFDEEIVGYMDYPTDQYAYFIILIPSYNPQIGPVNISKFETYVPGDTTNIVTYSLLENTATYNALVSSMNAITEFTDDTMTLGHIYGYNLGYQTGLETDKTLLSVMWQTFNLPFRLLFGTYDDTPGSLTYGQYVGGLFNFTILGVDIRAFCIGIMSFAIVLAVVRFVIGVKG